MALVSGKQAFLEILKSEGVSVMFGNPGTTELPLNDALAKDRRFQYVFGVHEIPVMAAADGIVAHIDTRALGIAVIELGGGRRLASDRIDPAVGLTGLAGRSAPVGTDRPLAYIHARDEAQFERAARALRKAYRLGAAPAPASPVLDRVGPETQ